MRALQYREVGTAPELVDVPRPRPAAGEVLIRILAAGACHSDLGIMGLNERQYLRDYPLPLTLGHEAAGEVVEVGEGVDPAVIGDHVLVYAAWGCGACRLCLEGKENYCPRARREGIRPPGLGAPGAMAEFMIVQDVRHLFALGALDPVQAVALTDAGLTAYHAVARALPALAGEGAVALVIGVGGLGHVAVQILEALSTATVVAVDTNPTKRELALRLGAEEAWDADDETLARVLDLTDGIGAQAVLDFVGVQATVDLATRAASVEAEIGLVGIGGGAALVGFGRVAYDAAVRVPYWGSRPELREVIALAREGRVVIEVERFALEEAPEAYRRLEQGSLAGRAVIVP